MTTGLPYRLGIIGAGNMGLAILAGALDGGVLQAGEVAVYDIDARARQRAGASGVAVLSDDAEVCARSAMVLFAVKPQQIAEALRLSGTSIEDKAVMSIVAGVDSIRFRSMASGDIRLLRVLPNTPALVREGVFALASDTDFTAEELDWAVSLYTSLGIVERLPEAQLDAVCGLSGGAPAYVAMFVEALADGGVKQGLSREVALRLAMQSCLGSAKMLIDTAMHPALLKDMVASPAGTTIEACSILEKGAFRGTLIAAVAAASERSEQLGSTGF